jgi:hypothetical protein
MNNKLNQENEIDDYPTNHHQEIKKILSHLKRKQPPPHWDNLVMEVYRNYLAKKRVSEHKDQSNQE